MYSCTRVYNECEEMRDQDAVRYTPVVRLSCPNMAFAGSGGSLCEVSLSKLSRRGEPLNLLQRDPDSSLPKHELLIVC